LALSKIHFVYPHGDRISCPDAIGRNVGKRLEKKYHVIYHDYDTNETIKPAEGDILLGHPTYSPNTCFRLSMRQSGWKRIIAMTPYHHGNSMAVAFLDPILRCCNQYLAITGNYWCLSFKDSLFSHWSPKFTPLDLAIDKSDFPNIKTGFNPPGKRKFLYIGSLGWTKNPGYLSRVATTLTDNPIYWIGAKSRLGVPGLISLGYQDFSTQIARDLISSFDFTITVSDADANPTTILETMSWGLIPICTPQSGYVNYPGIINVPLNEVNQTVKLMRELQEIPETTLAEMQLQNRKIIEEYFNWDRFTNIVLSAIADNSNPQIDHESYSRKLRIKLAASLLPFVSKSQYHKVRFIPYYFRRFLKSKITN